MFVPQGRDVAVGLRKSVPVHTAAFRRRGATWQITEGDQLPPPLSKQIAADLAPLAPWKIFGPFFKPFLGKFKFGVIRPQGEVLSDWFYESGK